MGMLISLGIILAAFEWSSASSQQRSFELTEGFNLEEEFTQITREKELKPPPPPRPQVAEILNILDDDDLIENEFIIEDVEAEQKTVIDIEPFVDDVDVADDIPFIIVEEMPVFQGEGLEGFRNWVMKNLRYPEIAAENGISGKVYIQFVVNSKGQVEDVKVIRGVDPSLEKESIRVVMSSPKWVPGRQRGKAVRVQFNMPINFVLQ